MLIKKIKTTGALFILLSIFILSTPLASAEDDSTVQGIVSELYNNYESVDQNLQEIKGETKRNSDPNATPFTMGIKKNATIDFWSIEVDKEGIPFASHMYTERDNKALEYGGRHILYKGKLKPGKHRFVLYYYYKTPDGVRKNKASWTVDIAKKPTYLELFFTEQNGKVKVIPRKTVEGS